MHLLSVNSVGLMYCLSPWCCFGRGRHLRQHDGFMHVKCDLSRVFGANSFLLNRVIISVPVQQGLVSLSEDGERVGH